MRLTSLFLNYLIK